MCFQIKNCCNPNHCLKDYDIETEEISDGIMVKIKADSPKKVNELKKMFGRSQEKGCNKRK